jgi:hypothetical protein
MTSFKKSTSIVLMLLITFIYIMKYNNLTSWNSYFSCKYSHYYHNMSFSKTTIWWKMLLLVTMFYLLVLWYIYIRSLKFILFGILCTTFYHFFALQNIILYIYIYIWDKHYFSHFLNDLPFISFQIILFFFPIHLLNKWMEQTNIGLVLAFEHTKVFF